MLGTPLVSSLVIFAARSINNLMYIRIHARPLKQSPKIVFTVYANKHLHECTQNIHCSAVEAKIWDEEEDKREGMSNSGSNTNAVKNFRTEICVVLVTCVAYLHKWKWNTYKNLKFLYINNVNKNCTHIFLCECF